MWGWNCAYKKIIAKPQILMSSAGFRNFFMEKASRFPSFRSSLMRRTMNWHSRSLRKRQDLCARSGKSTRKKKHRMPMKPVIWFCQYSAFNRYHVVRTTPSRMKIQRHPVRPCFPFNCIRPKARIPASAEATHPIR
jgi:hypothetical protein